MLFFVVLLQSASGQISALQKIEDIDGDGVPDRVEMAEGTDMADASSFLDTNEDGMPDYVEATTGTNYVDALSDSDGDGVPDVRETPSNPYDDYDNDGVPAYLDDDDANMGVENANGAVEPAFDADGNAMAEFQDSDTYLVNVPLDSYLVDTDLDGIVDSLDDDDDNDGILDIDEMVSCSSNNLIYVTDGLTRNRNRRQPNRLNADFIFFDSSYSFQLTFEAPQNIIVETTVGDWSSARKGAIIVGDVSEPFEVSRSNFRTVMHKPPIADNYTVRLEGSSVSMTAMLVRDATSGSVLAAFDFGSGRRASGYIAVEARDKGTINLPCIRADIDTDGDGIPDRIDLDSDGDNCPDAVEADGVFSIGDLVNNRLCEDPTCVDLNGVPMLTGSPQAVTTPYQVSDVIDPFDIFVSDNTICIGQDVTFTTSEISGTRSNYVTTANLNPEDVDYRWVKDTSPETVISTEPILVISNATIADSGSYTLNLITLNNSCGFSKTAVLTVNELPEPTFEDLPVMCSTMGTQIGLGEVAPKGGFFSGNGVKDSGNGSTFDFDPSDPTTGVGTHTITYTYTDVNGCTSSTSKEIEVYAIPLAPTSLITQQPTCATITGVVEVGGPVLETNEWYELWGG